MARCCGLLVLLLAAAAVGAVAPRSGLAVTSNACTITQNHSLEGTVGTDIRFVNRTAGVVKVYWLDYSGRRVYYDTIGPGASVVQPTWKTHPWVVLDASGACIGYVVAPRAEYVIGGTTSGAGPAAKKPTFTAVVCTIAVGVGSSTCTAQVADATPVRSNPPTGTVRFTAARGTVGPSCTLAGTPGSPGIASCTVPYVPASDLVAGEPPPVGAEYPGDAVFDPSSGGSSYTPTSVVIANTVDETSDGAVATTLVNENDFPVDTDEELTVPATTNTVMLRGGAAKGKPKVIAHTKLHLRPLASVAAKLRLTGTGRALLAKHGALHATLTVTTRAVGKPVKTTTRHVTIKAK